MHHASRTGRMIFYSRSLSHEVCPSNHLPVSFICMEPHGVSICASRRNLCQLSRINKIEWTCQELHLGRSRCMGLSQPHLPSVHESADSLHIVLLPKGWNRHLAHAACKTVAVSPNHPPSPEPPCPRNRHRQDSCRRRTRLQQWTWTLLSSSSPSS